MFSLNNTLPNNTNLTKLGLKNFAKCDICDGNQKLGHVWEGVKQHLTKNDTIEA